MNQSSIRGIQEARVALSRNERDPDFRRACIRDYVKSHPDEIIKLEDLAKAAYGNITGTSYTGALVKKLIKEGRLTRIRVRNGERGRHYSYKWHEQRLPGEPTLDHPQSGELRTREMTPEEREAAGLPPKDSSKALSSTLELSCTLKEIINMAKDFAWLENTDSLRDFIKKLEVERTENIMEKTQ